MSVVLRYISVFQIKRFLMMKDVMNVLNTLLKDWESTDSLEDLIHAVRDLINLIDSHECQKQLF